MNAGDWAFLGFLLLLATGGIIMFGLVLAEFYRSLGLLPTLALFCIVVGFLGAGIVAKVIR